MTASETDPGEHQEDTASNSRRDPLIGSVVNGKYRVHSAIARGGMGRIYYATQEPLERPVALKVVQGDGDQEHESQFLKRFLQEASILAKLQHPNVVTLFDYGAVEGAHVEQFFIAMEFLAGETLTHRLKAKGRLSAAETLVLTRQVVRGLREAHKRGIVHRDLKPSNIILVPEGDGSEIVKLVDFGIGKVMNHPGDAQDLTQDGVFVGTPRYMAPEQFEGTAYPASDLYALGTIMFQALAGRLPFDGQNMADLMVAKLARPVPMLREVAPDVDAPQSLLHLVHRLLARSHTDRPSIEEISNQLAHCEEEVFGSGTAQSMRLSGTGGSWPKPPNALLALGQSGAVPSASGSYPPAALPSSNPMPSHSRVPPTMVAPIPNLAQLTPPARSSEVPIAGRPVSAAPQSPSGARSTAIAAVVLVLLLLGGALVWWKAANKPPTPTADPGPSPNGSTATSSPTTPTGAAPAGTTFVLTLDSTPAGAAVYEGDVSLGNTPLVLTLDRASVAATPRTFTLKRDGFLAMQVTQGATAEASVRNTVTLSPDPTATAKKPAGKPTAVATTQTPPAKPTGAHTADTQPGLDIRMKR
ncbi:MAG: protein kinase [Deltaproteobacteria bacterium]|nr:protein kinase [Deltaproteobacteria bacterium]